MKKYIPAVFVVLTLWSCDGDKDLDNILTPSSDIRLIFPENLSECTEGVIISETQSEITFNWEAVDGVARYRVNLTDLENEETQYLETQENLLTTSVKRATPYSWSVASAALPNKIRSTVWYFYNEGPGPETFVPFPATALSPASGASISVTSTTVNLRWKSEDLDDDIIGYDLYFGENAEPELLIGDLDTAQYNNVPVTAGKTYYWKVTTKDSHGHLSNSELFSFTVG